MRSPLIRLSVLLLALLAVPVLHAQREKLPEEDLEIVQQKWPSAKKDSTGIRYIILREGTGLNPLPGETVAVLYKGSFLNGTTFDQSANPAKPFVFRVGREQVIQGWDYTLPQMKRGERRLLIVPPELAYGTRGQSGRIPRNATLVFEIELLEIKAD
ncbi:MAG: peptidylprolyl isomerase FKBP-type [Verrucomicrobia bacterium]|nr:peptidylprolyl isomerase FKBP-type [Verrucomicrobiota bacterium]